MLETRRASGFTVVRISIVRFGNKKSAARGILILGIVPRVVLACSRLLTWRENRIRVACDVRFSARFFRRGSQQYRASRHDAPLLIAGKPAVVMCLHARARVCVYLSTRASQSAGVHNRIIDY